MRLVLRDRMRDVTPESLARLSAALTEAVEWTVSDLSVRARVEPPVVLALFLCVEAERPGVVWYRIYHSCEEHPVASRPFRLGIPRGRFRCPDCERSVASSSLGIDIVCALNEQLEIVRLDRTSAADGDKHGS